MSGPSIQGRGNYMQRPRLHFSMSPIAQESSALAPRPKLLIKPSDLVHFQVSLLESHRTSEQQEMVPKLLLQGADNKTKLKNSHPQTSQHHTPAIASKALGLARIRRDTGRRKLSSWQAAVRWRRQGSLSSSVHIGTSNLQKLLFL